MAILEVTGNKQLYNFVGNPVLFKVNVDSPDALKVLLTIKHFRENAYEAKEVSLSFSPYKRAGKYYIEFDIASVLESYCCPIFERKQIDGRWTNGEVRYSISFPDFPSVQVPEKCAMPGGVSDTVFLNLMKKGTDIFAERFLNITNLFLFSNRSSSKASTVYYKSELCKAWFIRFDNHEFHVVNSAGNVFYPLPNKTGESGQYFDAVDLAEAYEVIKPTDGIMYVLVDGLAVFYVQVLPDPVREEKYLLEFRNSFGFMERILLTGKMKYEPEFTKGEEFSVNESNILRKRNRRSSFVQKYKGDIGYKRMSDILFLQDLLLSDEVRIYNELSEEFLPCSVSAEISLSMLQTEPESIPIEIKVLDSEKYISIDYNYRVFDKTFSEQFN